MHNRNVIMDSGRGFIGDGINCHQLRIRPRLELTRQGNGLAGGKIEMEIPRAIGRGDADLIFARLQRYIVVASSIGLSRNSHIRNWTEHARARRRLRGGDLEFGIRRCGAVWSQQDSLQARVVVQMDQKAMANR